jgi:hypothetical protein
MKLRVTCSANGANGAMLYQANEEPEITYTGSMHNAEIICTVRV